MGSDFPRVLIVSAGSIAENTGTGITLRNLFHDWPEDSLGQVHFGETPLTPPGAAILRYPTRSLPLDTFVRSLSTFSSASPLRGAPEIAAVPLAANAPLRARIHASVRSIADLSPVMTARSVDDFVDAFKPDVVYSLLGSVRMIRVAGRIAMRQRTPLVPHFMDDWTSTLYSSGEFAGLARQALLRNLGRTLRLAPVALCISDAMSAEYRRSFKVVTQTFMNPVECDAHITVSVDGSPLEFLYVGGLHLGRWESLLSLAQALQALEAPATRLTVYAPKSHLVGVAVPRHLRHLMTLAGSLEAHEVPARLRLADVLVHVESLDPESRRYTRLSVSTKIPQYMAVGRPIFAMGPAESASIQLISKSQAGLALTTSSPEAVARDLAPFVLDASRRSDMSSAGHAFAVREFESSAVRARFRRTLTEVVNCS